ncbi:UPF0195 protein YHR122W [Kluyveromyces marxianus]|uniref:UPF0195 protein YHR122W n=2 Tax=Kluyveromyces marxianus TaxID=4911 RepID=W0TEQ0_KLUMD|nr:uncharacterized protein KLMA_60262 [Kluyveromyces marxianus DMKU3-1042]QGN17301.1 UPF0195 protein YHR122W [Kluyveromyces marxianus]BAO41553.1 UPF0195 protein YHR122W [Kluyveromyces marxianus DMKU3-1042]BAP72993.1 UPF0195 protein YHR122W [Kluyveromyces marxianus]
MSEFINENPDVIDETLLPSRKQDPLTNELLDNIPGSLDVNRKRQLLQIGSMESGVVQNIGLLEKLLHQQLSIKNSTSLPDLTESETDNESESENEVEDPIDSQEIYDLIAHISDPEHPLTLGQLSVVNLADIEVHDNGDKTKMAEVIVRITPTITHCSLATLIGLGIRVRLERSLSPRFRITILLKKGTHQSENQVNKQLNDKERVAAACENDQLLGVVSKMLSTCK